VRDHERVKLVEPPNGLELPFAACLELIVRRHRAGIRETAEKTPRIRIDDENRPLECIAEDGVGGLRADAMDTEQRVAQLLGW
jgi:hypothetical protein